MLLHKRVVIVDDDKKVVMLLDKVLTKMGCKTYKAFRGKDALQLVKKEKPDLLISDMYMPDLQGAELVKKIRDDREVNHIKIILITAVYKELSMDQDVRAMTDGFIEKPIDIKVLVEMVIKLMR
jgi:CheY-like chemotaxis protein